MANYTVRWVAATDATVSTTYKVYTDKSLSGTFILEGTAASATDRGDGQYAPYSTTLNGALTDVATSITLTSGSNFTENDIVSIDGELIKLGAKATNTFSSCTRGYGGSVPVAHLTLATVYQAHEFSVITVDTWGQRKMIRVRITHNSGGVESVAAETVILNPTKPPTNDLATVYGILKNTQGAPKSGVTVVLDIASSGSYYASKGEVVMKTTTTLTTDADGYFEFFLPRSVRTEDDKVISLTIGTGSETLEWSAQAIPDVDYVNFISI